MAYGTFKSVAEVAKKFDIEVVDEIEFIGKKKLEIPDLLRSIIKEDLKDKTNYVSEYSICETLIRPILNIIVKHYPLKVWSHVSYHVDEKKGLMGEPDYLIAARTKYGEMARPSLCIIEAKKENFEEAWAQALAEMVASSLLEAKKCYGMVSTGEIWQFGKLEKAIFSIDSRSLSASSELQRVFDSINWVVDQINTIQIKTNKNLPEEN